MLPVNGERQSLTDRYFREFLSTKLHQRLLPDLQKLSVIFCIELSGPQPSAWTLTIVQGMLVKIETGSHDPICSFKLETDTFLEIAAGEVSPQFAFFQRKVNIGGKIEVGLRLATVLADFFKRFPFDPNDTAG